MRTLQKVMLAPIALMAFSLALASGAQAEEEVFIGGALSLTGIQAPLDEPTLLAGDSSHLNRKIGGAVRSDTPKSSSSCHRQGVSSNLSVVA